MEVHMYLLADLCAVTIDVFGVVAVHTRKPLQYYSTNSRQYLRWCTLSLLEQLLLHLWLPHFWFRMNKVKFRPTIPLSTRTDDWISKVNL